MEKWIIDNTDFKELPSEKYWSFPKSYKGDPKVEVKSMIYSDEYIGARKIDGAYYRFIKGMNGDMRLQGRSRSVNGDFLDKLDHVPQLMPFFNSLPNGTCLLGEIYFPGNEGSNKVTTIMGCLTDKAIQRQNAGAKLNYYVFDVWALDGESFLGKSMEERLQGLEKVREYETEYVRCAKYYEGSELWEELQTVLANGGEGVVITKKKSKPEPGKRTARKTLKIKRELHDTVDCFFTGKGSAPTKEYSGKEIETWKYWIDDISGEKIEGEKYKDYFDGAHLIPVTKPYFYGWAGSLEIGVLDGDHVVPIGWLSGLTDEIKANFKSYKGRCIEVTAMQWTDDGQLRHGKMMQFRDDLTIHDCTLEKLNATR